MSFLSVEQVGGRIFRLRPENSGLGTGGLGLEKERLRDHFFDYVPAEIRQLFVAAVVEEPEAILVEAEEFQNGRVEIAHVEAVADGA